MAKHGIRANRRKAEPKATIQAAPTFHERTHPAGSAERFLDDAAKEALAAAAAGGLPSPRQFVSGAVRAVAKEAEKYPDPLLAEAARLPREELMRRAAHAEAYQKAMEAQNEVVRVASTALSPAGNMVANQAGAATHDALTRQDWGGGNNTVSRVEFENTTEREKARRKAITDVEREAARPRIGGVSRIQQAAMAEADEALRLSTGIGRKGWLAIPKKKWDKLGQLEKERLAKTAQDAMETGMAYAVPGMMTYGSAAARLGNQPLMKTMLARKPWAEMTREERLALKRATRYEMGAQGMGVETLDDIRYIDGAKIPKRRYRGQHRIPDRAGTPVLDAFKIPDDLRSDPELLNMLRSTRVSLDDMGAKAYGLARKSHVDLDTRLFSDLTDLRDSTIAHEFDHVLHLDKSPAAPVASLNTSKMPGVYGERAATIDKDVHGWLDANYVFSPREVDARTTGARTALSPAERMATLREDIALRDPMTAEYVDHAKKRKLEWENSPVAKSFRQKMKAVGFDENTRGMENPLSLWELDNEGLRTEIRFLDPKARPIVQDLLQERLSQQDAKGGRTVRAAEGGGDSGSETTVSETPVSEAPVQQGGPRIVINPTTFHNKKDALCIAFNEGFRVWMEANGFEPQSEPTDAQRKFFSDTAYADDEVQLRRTILARIATFDTSVKDPTDDQLSETASFLGAILESDWCKNEWERDSVSRLMNAVQSAVGAEPVEPRAEPLEAREAEPLQRHAAVGGGETEDEEKFAKQDSGQSDQVDQAEEQDLTEREAQQPEAQQPEAQQPEAQQPEAQQPEAQQPEAPEQTASQRSGVSSGVWSGGAEGVERQLTAREAEWGRQAAENRVRGEQRRAEGRIRRGEATDADFALVGSPATPGSAPANAVSSPSEDTTSLPENTVPVDGRLRGGVDRTQLGRNGRIGIGARIVDPRTGKLRSSLSPLVPR